MHNKNSVAKDAVMMAVAIVAAVITAAGRPALSLLILSSMYIYQHREE